MNVIIAEDLVDPGRDGHRRFVEECFAILQGAGPEPPFCLHHRQCRSGLGGRVFEVEHPPGPGRSVAAIPQRGWVAVAPEAIRVLEAHTAREIVRIDGGTHA